MLTLILLVILGGGVGILAVSMAEGKPAMRGDGSRRAHTAETSESEPTTQQVAASMPTPASTPAPAPTPTPGRDPRTPVARTIRRTTDGLPRQVARGAVPSAQTAVEGAFHDLVRPSIPRRVLSLVGIVVIAVVIGVGIAALFGAVVGGAAEIVGNTIG
ncbi:MAG: hypothetical protein OSA99_12145 [Acidimicrobiales bacterium]|nr:hypothetical protein [Acidimicrobiales bacterium]